MANNQDCVACDTRVHGNDVEWIDKRAHCPRCAEREYTERAFWARLAKWANGEVR